MMLTETQRKILEFMVENDTNPEEENDPETISDELGLALPVVRAALAALEKLGLIVKSQSYTPTEKGMAFHENN